MVSVLIEETYGRSSTGGKDYDASIHISMHFPSTDKVNLPPVIRGMRSFPRSSLHPASSSTQSADVDHWCMSMRSSPVSGPHLSILLTAATREAS